MSLQTSGSMSDVQIMAEIQLTSPSRTYPLSSNDADLLALAGKSSQPLSVPADLYGKSSGPTGPGGTPYIPMTVTSQGASLDNNTTGSNYTSHLQPSATVINGTGSYSIQWAIAEATDGGFILSNANALTCDVAHAINRFGYDGSCTLSCTVNDGANSVTANNIVLNYSATDTNTN